MNGWQGIETGWMETLLQPRALAVGLWVGLGLLTAALLILLRTGWGQARPLSKCVVLSVLAHGLLMGYAYGTRLFFDYPPLVEEPVIQVTLLTDPPQELEQDVRPTRSEYPPRPWQRLGIEAAVHPELALLERRQVQVQGETQRSPVTQWTAMVDRPVTDVQSLDEPARPLAAPPEPEQLAAGGPGPQPAAIDSPAARRQQPSEDIALAGPPPGPLPRPQRPHNASADLAREAGADLPEQLLEISTPLQRLSQQPLDLESADALADNRDRLQRSVDPVDSADQQGSGASQPEDLDTLPPDHAPTDQVHSVPLGRPTDRAAAGQELPTLPEGAAPAVPRRLGDGGPVPELYRFRLAADRVKLAQRYGGNARAETAVQAALAWLANHQRPDGRWDASGWGAGRETRVLGHDRQGAGAEADTGISALALLAFLAAGHTHLEGDYRQQVQQGLQFLLNSQQTDGNLAGRARVFARMYCHGMASLALSEAYALTGDHRLKPAVQQAAQFIVRTQNPNTGGWRYVAGDKGDMSQFGWQVMALRSAELAGVEIPQRTRQRMGGFLDSVCSGSHRGLASYRPGERVSRPMTAEALACRFFLETDRDQAAWDEATGLLLEEPPGDGQANLYYWYYATLALYQRQDEHWDRWNRALQRQLLGRQRSDGVLAGSWDPDTVWGSYGGRVYSTALATLCLEVYYRYLPLYENRSRARLTDDP